MSDSISSQYPPPGQGPILPKGPVKPLKPADMSKKCDEFLKAKLKEIKESPFTNEEKFVLSALVQEHVVSLKQKPPKEMLQGMNALDLKVKAYLKVNEAVIASIRGIGHRDRSKEEKELMLQKLKEGAAAILADLREGRFDKASDFKKTFAAYTKSLNEAEKPIKHSPALVNQDFSALAKSPLDASAEKVSGRYANLCLNFTNRLALKQESRLLMSQLVQDYFVPWRASYRQKQIDLPALEAGLKSVLDYLPSLARKVKEFEKVQEETSTQIAAIKGSSILRNNLAVYIDKNVPLVTESKDIEEIIKTAQKRRDAVLKLTDYLKMRNEGFEKFEKPLLKKIEASGLGDEQKLELYELYDEAIAGLLEQLITNAADVSSLDSYLFDVEELILAKIEQYPKA